MKPSVVTREVYIEPAWLCQPAVIIINVGKGRIAECKGAVARICPVFPFGEVYPEISPWFGRIIAGTGERRSKNGCDSLIYD